jgi:hypothetical protein
MANVNPALCRSIEQHRLAMDGDQADIPDMTLSPISIALMTLLLLTSAPCLAQSEGERATASLGAAGGSLTISSSDDPRRPGTSRRTVVVVDADGATQTLNINDGGGHAANNAVNLYKVDQSHFRLVSQRDCVYVDGVRARLTICPVREVCRTFPGETYIGRFDWMNGFEQPHAQFRYRFRFLPAHDAPCST